ncbi:rhodanese-like domain-containing protein [Bordetella bronchiseptica]|uniref:rhodanese-like domain-containing protein n=1 Tax=Bordetella bronchiseptica TaxID=518 RepID=UPI000F7181C0|nr:rhodanese-like domain-containing protein [Bordetella bronchiseptica]VEF39210.1 molybdopterin biosynthesis protein MoeB [Bordetella bronchiseptica]
MELSTVSELRDLRATSDEYALFDVRESAQAHQGHIFGATFLPRRMLAARIASLVPRRSTPIVLYDEGGPDPRARLAAQTLARFGYTGVRVLDGGLRTWLAQGEAPCRGSNVPSKWFGETVHAHAATPALPIAALQAWRETGSAHRICDIRSPEEYGRARIPGAAGAFGSDLAWHADDLRRAGQPVVVHCSGRTRSIIACESLRLLGVQDAYALENGTMGWRLAGLALERGPGSGSLAASAASRRDGARRTQALARAAGVASVEAAMLARWLDERDAGRTNLYVLDIRQVAEYRAGHLPGAIALPGGLAVQRTDEFLPVRAAQVVLVDDDEARAALAGYWLRAMGLPRVAVLAGGLPAWNAAGYALGHGRGRPRPADHADAMAARPCPAHDVHEAGARMQRVYVDTQARFLAGRPDAAEWVPFGGLEAWLAARAKRQDERAVVLMAHDESLARSAALNARLAGFDAAVLAGGVTAWQAQGLPLASGPGGGVAQAADVVVQPYDAGLQAMRDYLEWEQALTRQAIPTLPLYTAYRVPRPPAADMEQDQEAP